MFTGALEQMKKLEREHGVDSVAFEMLGPPRLSKLLYEAHLLKLGFGNPRAVVRTEPGDLSQRLRDLIAGDDRLRSEIISIGIPILLPDGRSLLRGRTIKIPPSRGQSRLSVSPRAIDLWAHDGWVDLREKNMRLWRARLSHIISALEQLPEGETSSRVMHSREYWKDFSEIDPGKICGWIFTYEEKGKRMKA
jgi:hypothetical protein